MSGICWLASYPKSGNTWLRAFVENYVQDLSEPVSINSLLSGAVAYGRESMDDFLGLESADLPPEVVDRYRPRFYEHMADRADFRYLKTHERFRVNDAGEPVFSEGATDGVVLLVRNPMDVAVSLAHFMSMTFDQAIDRMEDESFTLAPVATSLYPILPQPVGSWSGHTSSWLKSGFRMHIVRYEDLLKQPLTHFEAIIRFIGLPTDRRRLQQAIDNSTFEKLKKLEATEGYRELATSAPEFFREGRADVWRDTLTPQQIDRIRNTHGEVMKHVGYE